MKKEFEIVDKEIVYSGFFRMDKYQLKHTLFAGGWSNVFSRELFVRGSCIAVLLYDPHKYPHGKMPDHSHQRKPDHLSEHYSWQPWVRFEPSQRMNVVN